MRAIATFTKLEPSDVEAILAQYRPDRLAGKGAVSNIQPVTLKSFRPIAAGTVNTNVALELASGERLFLRVNEGKTEAEVSLEARVVCLLAQNGVPTPSPLETKAGVPFARHGDKLVSLFPWVAGGHLTHAAVGPDEARQVGEALAQLHLAGAQFPERPEGIYTLRHLASRLESFRQSKDPVLMAHVNGMAEALTAAARHRAQPADGIREGIIHQDLFMDNVLFTTQDEPDVEAETTSGKGVKSSAAAGRVMTRPMGSGSSSTGAGATTGRIGSGSSSTEGGATTGPIGSGSSSTGGGTTTGPIGSGSSSTGGGTTTGPLGSGPSSRGGATNRPVLAALIDFEQAVWGRWVYDLAVCLLAWCFVGDAFVQPLVAAMLEGYESRLPLSDDERRALQHEAELAAVRFAITRVTDVYLAGATGAKDFRSYLSRLEALRQRPLLAP